MNKLTIKKATADDAVWVVDELGKGAKAGHFSESLLDQSQRTEMIIQVLLKNELSILKLRNGVARLEHLPADLWVAYFDGKPAGYLLSLKEDTGKPDTPTAYLLSILGIKRKPSHVVELLLGGTVQKFRGKGVFTALINHKLDITPRDARVYARCYLQSTAAISMFMSQGFLVTKLGDPIELTYYE